MTKHLYTYESSVKLLLKYFVKNLRLFYYYSAVNISAVVKYSSRQFSFNHWTTC